MIRKLLFRNFLFVYRVSQWLSRRFTSTGLLVLSAFIIAAVFGVNIHQTMAYQAATLLLSVLLLSFISVIIYRQKLYARRILPGRGAAGQPLHYSLMVDNPGRRHTAPLIVLDELSTPLPRYDHFVVSYDAEDRQRNYFDRIMGYPRLVTLIHKLRGGDIPIHEYGRIPPGNTAEIKMTLLPVRRGYVRFERILLGKCDPFGLLRRFHRYTQPDSLLILPKLYDFPPLRLAGRRTYQPGGVNQASAVGDSEEFFSLREYRSGDSMRNMHWRSYAHTGKPVVKEYQDEYFARIGLALDTFIGNKPDLIFEEAVSVAASIALAGRQQDSLLDLMFIHNRAYRFTSGRGNALDNILEVLACVETNPDENVQHLRALLLQHAADTSAFICILSGWDSKRQALIEELQVHGVPVLTFIIVTQEQYASQSVLVQTPGVHILPAGDIASALKQEFAWQ